MKLTSIATAAIFALAGSLLVATPVNATGTVRDARVANICPDMCVKGRFSHGAEGAWFIDGTNTAVLVDYRSFRVINTATSKTIKIFSAPRRKNITAFALSSDKSYAVAAFSNGAVNVYNSEWESTRINPFNSRTNVRALAISDDGNDVYLGRWSYEDGNDSAVFERWDTTSLQESFTGTRVQGISVMKLSNDDSTLYAGFDGAAPTLQSFDSSDISAGPLASDNGTRVWSVDNIEITADGRLFATNTSNRLPSSDSDEPRILEYDPTTLEELDSYNTDSEWQRWAIGLSAEESTLFAMGSFVSQGSPDQPNKVVEFGLDSLDPLDGILEIPAANGSTPKTIDIDPTGTYLLASTWAGTFIVALRAGSYEPFVEYDYGTNVAYWDYLYLNPRAKFKWFEVKYKKLGSSKWTVKRVKRSMAKYVNEFTGGTDAIQVRAVYTRKKLNSSWGTVDVAP